MRHFLFFVFIFCLQLSYSQSVFNPGYIISNQNDTTYGLIENNSFVENAKYCVFKKSDNSEIIRYAPAEIKAYRFTDGKYYSSEIIYETPVFLEYLVKGNLNLFYHRNEAGKNFFYVSKNNFPITELISKNSILNNEDGSADDMNLFPNSYVGEKSFQVKKFIGVLRYYTDNHPKLTNSINDAELTHQSLIAIVNKYNTLTGGAETKSTYAKKFKRKIILQTGVGVLIGIDKPENSIKVLYMPTFGTQVLFQQSERNENLYLGIGIYPMTLSVPLSINYISQKQGFSPTYSYGVNLLGFAMLQKAEIGLSYRMKNLSFNLSAGVQTYLFVKILFPELQLKLGYHF